MKKAQKSGFGVVGIIVVIAAVAVLGSGFLYFRELKRVKNLAAPPPAPATQNQQVQQPAPQAPSAKLDTSTWKTYRNEQYGFVATYDKNIFKEETSVESLPPEYDKKVSGVKLIHLIPVQYCNAKGQCQPETKNMAIGFYPFASDFREAIRPIKDFFGVELKEITIAGRKGAVVHTGAEGEGRYYYFLPSHWIGQTLLITRDYIDERVITSYKGSKEFMSLLKQEEAFDSLIKTLIFAR